MKNNNLIKYKENILKKILNFFRNVFLKRKLSITEDVSEGSIKIESQVKEKKVDFIKNIKVEEDEEKIRLKKLQKQYDNGEIDEDSLSESDIEKLITLYENETKELNAETEMIKSHISPILKKLKAI